MIGTLIIVCCVCALACTLLFLCCLCATGCGLLSWVTPLLTRLLSSSHDQPYQEGEPINSDCFFCLERVTNEVVATCNHSYCGDCISDYIAANEGARVNCPACRREILVLFRRFNPTDPQQRAIKHAISQYNYKYTRQPSLMRSMLEFANIARHLPLLLTQNGVRFLLTDPRLKYVLLLALYALSPFDLVPEALFGPLGLIDDGMALAGILTQLTALLYSFMREEGQSG